MGLKSGLSLFDAWQADVWNPNPPPAWSSGDSIFDHVEVAPGRIILVAGPPGGGKTALIGQWSMGLLLNNPALRVLVANVEMTAHALLTRQLSRLSDVPLTAIRRRETAPKDRPALDLASGLIRSVIDRLAFADDPSDLDAITESAREHRADALILDYVQRIEPGGKAGSLREKMNLMMSRLRRIADGNGVCVLAACAVSRSRDDRGRSSYGGEHISMASLRESGELEFGADDVLILSQTDGKPTDPEAPMLLAHAKCRHGEPADRALTFHKRTQKFEVDPWETVATSAPSRSRNGRT